jgi:hypothetical protein
LDLSDRVVSALENPRWKGDGEFYHHTQVTTIKRRRVEITIFEEERVVRHSATTQCSVCRLNSEMLTPEQASELVRVQVESIHEWLAQGKAHGMKTTNGQDRVCRNSLFLK